MKKPILYVLALAAYVSVPFNAYAIFGGQNIDSKDYKKSPVVALIHSEDSSGGGLICTATLLNARTVLTAAHCVLDEYNYLQRNVSPGRRMGSGMRISKSQINIHPEYNRKKHLNDLAIIKLNSDLRDTQDVIFPELNELSEYDLYKIFGYGEDAKGNDGELRTVSKAKSDIKKMRANDDNTENYLEFDQRNGSGICSGDSGGPVFAEAEGKTFIVAINTSATNEEKKKKCSHSGIVTKVNTALGWIKSYL
ncbi:S1 family peptidase [bacterium]|nr:S1 family peptidase [bacterium]